MSIQVICKGRVSYEAAKVVADLVLAALSATRIKHPLPIYLVPAPTVSVPGCGCGFAVFRLVGGRPQIWLGTVPVGAKLETFLRENLAHELAHYEQFRDGKVIQERGVAVRARTLAKAMKRVQRKDGGR